MFSKREFRPLFVWLLLIISTLGEQKGFGQINIEKVIIPCDTIIVDVKPGGQALFQAEIQPMVILDNGDTTNANFIFTVDDQTIASLDKSEGSQVFIRGVSPGFTTFTARAGDKAASKMVEVRLQYVYWGVTIRAEDGHISPFRFTLGLRRKEGLYGATFEVFFRPGSNERLLYDIIEQGRGLLRVPRAYDGYEFIYEFHTGENCLGTGKIDFSIDKTSVTGSYVFRELLCEFGDDSYQFQAFREDISRYGEEGEIGFYHELPQIKIFQERKFLTGTPDDPSNFEPVKICADGSNATIVKYRNNSVPNLSRLQFRMKDDLEQTNPGLYGSFSDPKIDGLYIESVYSHPTIPPGDGLTAELADMVVLEETEPGSNNQNPIFVHSFPMEIYRAPVVMIHGLWSSGEEAFGVMDRALTEHLWPKSLTQVADYSRTNASHFSVNELIPKRNSLIAIYQAREDQFSAGKVDVVAHSMGGLLARKYLRSEFYQRYRNINRFITVNTPHSGTQMANWMVSLSGSFLERLFIERGKDTRGGAVWDLQVDSDEITKLRNIESEVSVPSHAIVTEAEFADASFSVFHGALIIFSKNRTNYEGPDDFLEDLYNSDDSDLIVPLTSQQGGLSSSKFTSLQNIWHVGVTEDASVIEEVSRLLSLDPQSPDFEQDGFRPQELTFDLERRQIFSHLPYSGVRANESVVIISPSDGDTFLSGDSIDVTVAGIDDSAILVLLAGSKGSDGVVKLFDTGMKTTKYEIPNDVVGPIELKVFAVDTAFQTFASDSLSINVNVASDLLGINSVYDNLILLKGDKHLIKVLGNYEDRLQRTILQTNQLIFEIADENIVSVTSPGIFVGNNEGKTEVTITYKKKETRISVDVLSANAFDVITGVDINDDKDDSRNIPNEFMLLQNYPNPFNPTTTIRYDIDQRSHIQIVIFNLLGQEIRTLVNDNQLAGNYSVNWDGRDRNDSPVSTGIYIYQLRANNEPIESRKMLLIK